MTGAFHVRRPHDATIFLTEIDILPLSSREARGHANRAKKGAGAVPRWSLTNSLARRSPNPRCGSRICGSGHYSESGEIASCLPVGFRSHWVYIEHVEASAICLEAVHTGRLIVQDIARTSRGHKLVAKPKVRNRQVCYWSRVWIDHKHRYPNWVVVLWTSFDKGVTVPFHIALDGTCGTVG